MTQCVVAGCSKDTKKHLFCTDHKCVRLKCQKHRTQTQFCDDHMKRCRMCAQPVADGKKLCVEHACVVDDCDGVSDGPYNLCTNHRCSIAYCTAQKITEVVHGPLQEFVRDSRHIDLRYTNPRSAKLIERAAQAMAYCHTHKCVVDICKNNKFGPSEYCIDHHTCKVCHKFPPKTKCSGVHHCDLCGEVAVANAIIKNKHIYVCGFHAYACASFGCKKSKSDPRDTYCSEHRCSTFRHCNKKASPDADGVCEKHKCVEPGCRKEKDNNRPWCYEHSVGRRLRRQQREQNEQDEPEPKATVDNGRICVHLTCTNKTIKKNKMCINHYWKPRCLYCLSDGACSAQCPHSQFCELPCRNKLCVDTLYIRKNNRTNYNYYMISKARYIADNMPKNALLFPIVMIIASYV